MLFIFYLKYMVRREKPKNSSKTLKFIRICDIMNKHISMHTGKSVKNEKNFGGCYAKVYG